MKENGYRVTPELDEKEFRDISDATYQKIGLTSMEIHDLIGINDRCPTFETAQLECIAYLEGLEE